jgi:hypothetical protein
VAYEVRGSRRSASKSKTGFKAYQAVGGIFAYYKKIKVDGSQEYTRSYDVADCGGTLNCGLHCHCASTGTHDDTLSASYGLTGTYDPTTGLTTFSKDDGSATWSGHRSGYNCTPESGFEDVDCGSRSHSPTTRSGSATLNLSPTTASGATRPSSGYWSWSITGDASPVGLIHDDPGAILEITSPTTRTVTVTAEDGNETNVFTDTLSDENTTAALLSACESALSSAVYTDTASPSASRSLASNEESVTFSEAKYTIHLSAPQAAHCKIRLEWDEVFTPDGGGSPTTTPRTFDWDLGKPCKPKDVDDMTIDTDEYTLAVPATNGTLALANFVISYPKT